MQNWRRYTLEFLSIFIAVIAAFALNNWNDNRKDRIAENKILYEIKYGLEKDIQDIKMNMDGHRAGLESIDYYLRTLSPANQINKDSFLLNYIVLTRDFFVVQNTSGYETLKSRGLELIQNDSLRSKIISVYEGSFQILRKFKEEFHESQFQKNYFTEINTLIAPFFELNDKKEIVGLRTPVQLQSKDEKKFVLILKKIQYNRLFILSYYNTIIEEVSELLSLIKQEIERLNLVDV